MLDKQFWAIGIAVRCSRGKWVAHLDFFDAGFCQDKSTVGTLTTRYYVDDLAKAIDTVKADAERMGITWRENPWIHYDGDGVDTAYPAPPPDWEESLRTQATRIGWNTY